jgi:hypothetical protein
MDAELCSWREFVDRHDGEDICFLVQERPEALDNWFVPDKGINTVGSINDAVVWDLEALIKRNFTANKRFHILPPLPPGVEESPGQAMFRLLASHPGPQTPNRARELAERVKLLRDKGLLELQKATPNIFLLSAIEAIYSYAYLLNTEDEKYGMLSYMEQACERYNNSKQATVHPFNAGVRGFVQGWIGTNDQPPF